MTLHSAATATSTPPAPSHHSHHPSSLVKKSDPWKGTMVESQQDSPFLVSSAANPKSTSYHPRQAAHRAVAPGPVPSAYPPPPNYLEASRLTQAASASNVTKHPSQMAVTESTLKKPTTPVRATRHAKTAAASALGSSSPMAAPSPAAGMRKGHPASDHASYATGSVLATSSLSMSSAAASAHMSTLASHHYYKSNSSPMHPKAGLPTNVPLRAGTKTMYERLLANGTAAGGHAMMMMSSEADADDGDCGSGRADKNGMPAKGLRQFSLRVCKKVEEKGITTYNEVADDLVKDLGGEIGKGDQKNIRRRVYDALNVLMAMDIIRKEKKEIIWLGLPNDLTQDLESYQNEKQMIQARLLQKKKALQEMVLRQTALKNLIQRNKAREEALVANAVAAGLPPASVLPSSQDILHLPFILINAPRDCRINCEMLEDRSHYFFEFDAPFLIHEDIEILRLMGLCQINPPLTPSTAASQAHSTGYSALTHVRYGSTAQHGPSSSKKISPGAAIHGKAHATGQGHSHALDAHEQQMNEFLNMTVEFPDIHELDFDALPDLDPLLTLFQEDPNFPPAASSIPLSGVAGFSTTFRHEDLSSSAATAEPSELSSYANSHTYPCYPLSSEPNKSHPSLSSSMNVAFDGLQFGSDSAAAMDENDMEALMQSKNYSSVHETPSKRCKLSSDAAYQTATYSSPAAPTAVASITVPDATTLETNPTLLAKQRNLRRKLPL